MSRNPWLDIPASDYEAHMSSPEVAQAQMLAEVFGESLRRYDPSSVAVLGATTGNGLEKIDTMATRRVTAVDINQEYLDILRSRFEDRIGCLETIRADLEGLDMDESAYSLVFAGLVFEYVEPRPLLGRIAGWLRPGGVLAAVLQMPGPSKVTSTPYESLRLLEPVMELVAPCSFRVMAVEAGLDEIDTRTETLESGKTFFIGAYARPRD